jgi:hypothetical protein
MSSSWIRFNICSYLQRKIIDTKQWEGLILITIYRKTGFSAILFCLFILSACEDPIYNELGVDGENVPSFSVTDRTEKKRLVRVNYKSVGSGEEDAKQSVADSFIRLKEEYGGVIVKLTDKEGENWYGVYIKNKNFIDGLGNTDSEELTEDAKMLKSFHESYDDPQYPIIKFSKEPILNK